MGRDQHPTARSLSDWKAAVAARAEWDAVTWEVWCPGCGAIGAGPVEEARAATLVHLARGAGDPSAHSAGLIILGS